MPRSASLVDELGKTFDCLNVMPKDIKKYGMSRETSDRCEQYMNCLKRAGSRPSDIASEVAEYIREESAKTGENIFARIAFDDYEGGFTAWLVPRVDPCFKVELRDAQREYENGVYFVVGTETSLSASGGARTIKLGRRLG